MPKFTGKLTSSYTTSGNGNRFRTVHVPQQLLLPSTHPSHRWNGSASVANPIPAHSQEVNPFHEFTPDFRLDLQLSSSNNNINHSNSKHSKGRYVRFKEHQNENWTSFRTKSVNAFVESLAPSSLCDCCGEDMLEVFHCEDCMPQAFLCEACVAKVHTHQHFHIVYVWKKNAWVRFTLQVAPIECPVHKCFEEKYLKKIIVVDSKGRHHFVTFRFCRCECESITLIRHHLWPASPIKPKICFCFHIMEMLRVLYLMVPVPVRDFCEALKFIYHPFVQMENPVFQDIYKVLINESFEEYRYFIHQMETLATLCSGLEYSKCPACPQKNEYQRIISMDANMGLVRKKSSGSSVAKPKHDLYFIDQNGVDKFVAAHSKAQPSKEVDCNDFKAGSMRSKARHEKLDETAVFGAACRHDFPQLMFSLKHGERLAYPVYLIQQLLERHGDTNFYFMYDIACMLDNHVKKHYPDMSLDSKKFAIPIFHSYGHKFDCQVQYSPRRNAGFALTDGECLERLWSYLRSFSKITKEMTPSHRVDTLTDALVHYANRNYLKIGTFLSSKMEKAKDITLTSSKELAILLSTMQATTADVRNWMFTEQRSATCKRQENHSVKSEKDRILPLLHRHCTERKILLEMMNKYAVGQAIAIRLQKNINSSNKAIRSLLAQVNKELSPPLTYEEAIEFKFLLDSDQPYQRRAAHILNMKERAEEEVELLEKEIANVAMVMRDKHATLISSLSLSDLSDSFSKGRNSLILSKIVLVERQFSTFKKACGAYVDIQSLNDAFKDKIPYTQLEVDDIGFSPDDLASILEEVRAQEAEDDIVSDNENEDQENQDEEYYEDSLD